MPPYSTVSIPSLVSIVAKAVASAKANYATIKAVPTLPTTSFRETGAFRFGWLRIKEPPPPVIFDSTGIPIHPPPIPSRVDRGTITRAFDWANLAVGETVTSRNISPILDELGREIDKGAKARITPSMSKISARREIPGVGAVIDEWIADNVKLIESGIKADKMGVKLRPSLLQDVFETVLEAHEAGMRVEGLAGLLQERFGVSDSRAELIARDQTNKLAGKITKHRQTGMGITHYRWLTSRDDRVRETHAALNGTKQSWNSPPKVANGRWEHPGGDYQCRCQAIPIIEDL
jgi:SPP1 gp7 family putative phage head morphogenesis protein